MQWGTKCLATWDRRREQKTAVRAASLSSGQGSSLLVYRTEVGCIYFTTDHVYCSIVCMNSFVPAMSDLHYATVRPKLLSAIQYLAGLHVRTKYTTYVRTQAELPVYTCITCRCGLLLLVLRVTHGGMAPTATGSSCSDPTSE
jgi:hypothetical protein